MEVKNRVMMANEIPWIMRIADETGLFPANLILQTPWASVQGPPVIESRPAWFK
jgi:hypothetical protein